MKKSFGKARLNWRLTRRRWSTVNFMLAVPAYDCKEYNQRRMVLEHVGTRGHPNLWSVFTVKPDADQNKNTQESTEIRI